MARLSDVLVPRMAQVELPIRETQITETKVGAWIVTVFNNETNTYEEVINILVLATGCTTEEAYIETWEIDHFGQCVVHRAAEEECRRAAEIIAKIGIKVVATPED